MYITGDEFHSIVNGQSGRDGSTGGVDVEGDVFIGVIVGEVEELGYEDVGYFVVYVGSEEEDAVFEETGDYIDLSTGGSFDGWEGWCSGAAFGLL